MAKKQKRFGERFAERKESLSHLVAPGPMSIIDCLLGNERYASLHRESSEEYKEKVGPVLPLYESIEQDGKEPRVHIERYDYLKKDQIVFRDRESGRFIGKDLALKILQEQLKEK